MLPADQKEIFPRRLSRIEILELRRDMAESSAWMRAELKCHRKEKAKHNAEHGTSNGTGTEPSPKQLKGLGLSLTIEWE